MKTNIINTKSILPNSFRFDPSFHLSEAIILGKDLDNVPYEKISIKDTNSKVFLGNIFSRIFVKDKEHGIPYLAASDTVLADINTGRFLSKKQSKELAYLMLKKDWIVITCSGTIGNVTYTNSTFENHIATHDLIRIVPNDEKILKGYLYAFLSSKYGYNQLTQSRFGGVVKHINADHVNGITLPLFPESYQKEVDDLIQESARLREEATEALEKAHTLIEKHFDCLENIERKSVNIKEINKDNIRFDASYHLSDSKKYEIKIESLGYTELSNLCADIFGGGRAKRYYTADKTKGVPYLSNSDLSKANPLRTCKYSLKSRIVESETLKKGMIVTGRVGAIGQTQIIGSQFDSMKVMASDNVIRILPKNNYGYIYAFLSSCIGNSLFWKYATGGVQPFISSSMVGKIKIPHLGHNVIDECNQLIELYSLKREESNIKEEKAILMVEQEIEKWNKN